MELVKGMEAEIKHLGFDFEVMNKSSIAIQGIPSETQDENVQHLFEDFLEQFKNNAELERKDNFARALAKSMSIKKGRKMNTTEMHILIDELFACQMPHATASGKPTLITLTLDELAKKF
jgi:DNA mismatch repair protein MutL